VNGGSSVKVLSNRKCKKCVKQKFSLVNIMLHKDVKMHEVVGII